MKRLLLLLRLGSKREAVRGPLLDALLAYLQACRGPRIAHASADLFQAAISGWPAALTTLLPLCSLMMLPPPVIADTRVAESEGSDGWPEGESLEEGE